MESCTLESICSRVSSGGTPSRKRPEYFTPDSGGHLWVKSKELLDGSIHDTEEKITDDGLSESAAKYFPANTVLVAMYGANVGQLGWLRQPATVNQAICGLVVDEKKADWRFVFYSLLQNRGDLTVQAQGAAQQNLNQDLVRQFQIVFPPLPVQRRIAGILSAYDELMENSQRRILLLEAMARVLYREWFVRFRFPGHEKLPRVTSPLGEIPQGWEVTTFGELYNTGSGGTPSRARPEYFEDGTIDWVKSQELLDSFVLSTEERITERALKESSAKLFPANAVLIALYGATIGKLAILSRAAATNQACCAILPKRPSFGREFAFQTLLLNRERIIGLRLGAAQQNISQVLLRNLDCVKPSDKLVSQFSERTAPLFDGVLTLQRQIQNLRRTRDLLLPRLLSGQVELATGKAVS
jgi:type I restriction enzyme, S subunit